MGQIPRETIERIIDENDILEVVSAYFPLKRSGTRMVALCPFHNEKSPSFGVNTQRQIFHCFGCGEGGDVIKFVMKYENLSFPEAAKKLADRVGIPIIEGPPDPKEEARRRQRKELEALQKKACEWYHHCLLRSQQAQPARDYLKSRGFGIEIAKRWMFGYAPADSRITMEWAREQGFSPQLLVDGGLAQWDNPDRGSGRAYARFRHRLMFPVANDYGNVIAFSGRVLSPDQKGGKYVNSPETILFNKSKTFFGLEKSKRAIARENRAVVVEGQLDMISAFESGIENIVAPLGTAFTEQHSKLLKRQSGESGEIVLCYDSDAAGFNAVVKAFQILAADGLLVRVGMLPDGEDPDSLIKSQGPEALRTIVDEAPEFFDFLIDRHSHTRDLADLRERLAFVRELAGHISLIKEQMLQDSLIHRVATRVGVGEAEVRKLVIEEEEKKRRRPQREGPNDSDDPGVAPAGPPAVSPLSNRSIRTLCEILLNHAETRDVVVAKPPPSFLHAVPGTEFLARLWEADFDPDSNASVLSFTSSLLPHEQGWVTELRGSTLPNQEGLLEVARSCLVALKKKAIQSETEAIKAQLGNPHLSKEEQDFLSRKLLDLHQRLTDIPQPDSSG